MGKLGGGENGGKCRVLQKRWIHSPCCRCNGLYSPSKFSESDPPTFVTASKSDRIVNVDLVKRRVANLKNAGIDVEYVQFDNIGHGFGLGTGTEAEGWIDRAISFWEKQMKAY